MSFNRKSDKIIMSRNILLLSAVGLFFTLVLHLTFLPMPADGRIGVAIGTGKIYVDEPLKPGIINILPSIGVINNGDETSSYEMSVEYLWGQESDPELGLMPPREWFVFKPQTFTLEPGQRQVVEISLVLPINAKPGRYFAFLQAKPTAQVQGEGTTKIGIAAAAKLWFDVVPANVWFGIYYRLLSLYQMYSFWINAVVSVMVTAILIALFRKFFKVSIQLRTTSLTPRKEPKDISRNSKRK